MKIYEFKEISMIQRKQDFNHLLSVKSMLPLTLIPIRKDHKSLNMNIYFYSKDKLFSLYLFELTPCECVYLCSNWNPSLKSTINDYANI